MLSFIKDKKNVFYDFNKTIGPRLTNEKEKCMKRSMLGLFGSGLAGVFCASVIASAAEPAPVLDFDFAKSENGVIRDGASSGLRLTLGEDAEIEDNALVLTPSEDSFAAADEAAFRNWAKKLDTREISAAFWIRFDEGGIFASPRNADKASLGLFDCFRTEDGRIGITVFTKKTELMKPVTMYSKVKAEYGKWYHVEFSYSMNRRRYALYIDGKFQMENDRLIIPVPAVGELKLGDGFRGAVRDLKFYDAALENEELSISGATADDYDKLKAEAQSIAVKNIYLQAMCRELANRAVSCKGKIGKVSTAAYKRLAKAIGNAKAVAEGISKENTVSDKVVTAYVTPATTNALYLPYDLPENGSISNQVNIVAAQDEFETASVIIFPFRPVKQFTMSMTDLKNGKNVIPGKSADIKIVKRWYRTGGAWMTYHVDLYTRVLTPDNMVYDDSLFEVDEFRRTNKVRLAYPSGTEYVDISEFLYYREWLKDHMLAAFKDAETLQPADLKEAGRNLQYMITLKVPKGTAPGLYTGKLNLTADGKNAGTMDVNLKVLPFVLPQPKTYDNTANPYISHVNYSTGTEECLKFAMDHNMMHLARVANNKDAIRLSKKVGYPLEIIFDSPDGFRGEGWDFGGPESKRTPEYNAQMERMALAPFLRLEKDIETITGKKDFILYRVQTSEASHYNAVSQGPDQLSEVLNSKTRTRLFSHGMTKNLLAFSPGIYDMDSATNRLREWADVWHAAGGRAITYAHPFPGPESPGLMRRTLGLELYKHDRYDGHMMHGFVGTQLNEFTKYPGGDGDYRNFDMALQTGDGRLMESTSALGYREAFDDVRYATALKVQAENALKNSKDELVRKEAKRQLAWLERVDGIMMDMDAFRANAQYRIVTLQNLINERKGK